MRVEMMTLEEFKKQFSETNECEYQIYRFGFLDCEIKCKAEVIDKLEGSLYEEDNKCRRLRK